MNLKQLFITFLFIPGLIYCQDSESKRQLRPFLEQADTFSVQVKYNKQKQIKYLNQSYTVYEENTTYIITEKYKKNKFWTLFRHKEVEKEGRRNRITLYEINEGKQYNFNEKGQIIYIFNYHEGEIDEIQIAYKYYENGKLKFIAEIKNNEIWNFIEYRYPNGDKYDFGDPKNGAGTVIHLNEDGEPCIECTIKKNKTVRKVLCDEQS